MQAKARGTYRLLAILGRMDEASRALIEAIHGTPTQVVLAVSGAGTQALAHILGVGGASRTVLEATVPYAQAAFAAYAGTTPAEFASPEAAHALAIASRRRALALTEGAAGTAATPVVGIGCAAAIATDRLKRGDHRAYVACAALEGVRTWSLRLEKGARDRAAEEDLVSRLVINVLAEACGLDGRLDLVLRPGEELRETSA